MRMTDSQGAALAFFYSSEFRRKWSKVHTNGRGGEEYFAFWGFTLSEHIRNLLLSLIAFVFNSYSPPTPTKHSLSVSAS